MHKNILIMLLSSLLWLTGCTNNGNLAINDQKKIEQIKINKSRKDQVKNILGEPKSVAKHSDGSESWVYENKNTTYTEKYAAKKAISFVPIPYLGMAVGLADNAVDMGPDKIVKVKSLTLQFDKRGVLRESKIETDTL